MTGASSYGPSASTSRPARGLGVMKNPAAGGGRWVDVSPERLVSWIVTFGRRHGDAGLAASGDAQGQLTFTAADGATAECHPPFPQPHRPDSAVPALVAGAEAGVGGPDPEGAAAAMAAYAAADRTVGVLLVRLGGYAVGVFAGAPPQLLSSKTGSRPVHGRSAAGGWSQHRFARRRENQATRRRPAGPLSGPCRGPVPHRPRPAAGRAQGGAARLRRDPHPADRARTEWLGAARPSKLGHVLPTPC
jgi:hypothetical protein